LFISILIFVCLIIEKKIESFLFLFSFFVGN